MPMSKSTDHDLGELAPTGGRRFVGRAEFASAENTATVDPTVLRADQDAAADHALADPYDR